MGSEFSHAQGFEQRGFTVASKSLAEATTQWEISAKRLERNFLNLLQIKSRVPKPAA